jgi:transcriptional regulator with XRE-family HTH domain
MDPSQIANLSNHLGQNLKTIRELRGYTQEQLAKLCELPRSTVANIEIGGSNPTLSVLIHLSSALRLSLEELLSRPRARCQVFERDSLPSLESKRSGDVSLRRLLPHPIPGMSIDRMELAPGSRFAGSPHSAGTHEFLCCEKGQITLWIEGEQFNLKKGDVAAFQGDQRHTYHNPGRTPAIGFSVVSLAPASSLLDPIVT